ncbi:MAG: MFS transporter [Gammaproteobacteria bacterium]|nr:MFS transporter [Gammaproteobacteria bacterium]
MNQASLSLREYWPRRYTVAGLSVAAMFVCYMDRVNISIAIIPMSKELDWSPDVQGMVLSSFFIGYLLTQVLCGRLADRFGGKLLLGIAVLVWSLFTFITPFAAYAGFAGLILARIGMGAGEGVALPAIYSLYGRWLPRNEAARAIGATFSAIPLGIVFGLLVTPWIVLNYGWQWAFYSFGLFGLVWFVIWQRLATSYPDTHPSISESELALIKKDAAPKEATESPPWRILLSSPAVWAIIVGHFCSNWGTYVLLAWLPTYVNKGLNVDFASVGIFSMFPYIAAFLFFNIAGFIADKLSMRGWQTTKIRKTMQSIGFGGPALILLFVGYVESASAAIALMTLANIFIAFSAGGFIVNHLDIAPRYAGVLMGLSNTAGTIPGIIGVYVSGLILSWTDSWTLVFQVAAAVYLFGLVFYLVFASGKRLFD